MKQWTPRKGNDQPLKDALQDMLHAFRLDQKFRQQKMIASWENLMGKAVANRTREIIFRDKKLFVYLNSAALREELVNSRDKIRKMLNEEAGAEVIEEIIFQ